MKSIAAFVAIAFLSLGVAAAEPRSWEVGKTKLPSSASLIVGINVATIQQSQAYKTLAPKVIEEEDDVKETLDLIKGSCGIDALTSITDVVVAFDIAKEEGLVVIGLAGGIDQAKALGCLQKVAAKTGGGEITSKTKGKVTEYAMAGKPMLFAAWLANDVIALTTRPDKKGALEKMLKGKPKAELAKLIAKVNTGAAVWAVAGKGALVEADTPKGIKKPKGLAGVAELSGGKFNIDAKLTMASAGDATKMLDEANRELAREKADMPPDLAKVISAIVLATAGADLTIKGSVADADVIKLISAM
jgi:hypothetical protein